MFARLTIESFLDDVWRSGALLGSKPQEAYVVRCDRTTMSQSDLDNGRLICQRDLSMAVTRDNPYGPFKFQVTISPESGGRMSRGLLGLLRAEHRDHPVAYREDRDPSYQPSKIQPMNKAGQVTLKRGLIGAHDFWQWVDQVWNGNMLASATVEIQLRSEDSAAVVATWKLICAKPSEWICEEIT